MECPFRKYVSYAHKVGWRGETVVDETYEYFMSCREKYCDFYSEENHLCINPLNATGKPFYREVK